MIYVKDNGWEEYTVLLCPPCAIKVRTRAVNGLGEEDELAREFLLAGGCGHPEAKAS